MLRTAVFAACGCVYKPDPPLNPLLGGDFTARSRNHRIAPGKSDALFGSCNTYQTTLVFNHLAFNPLTSANRFSAFFSPLVRIRTRGHKARKYTHYFPNDQDYRLIFSDFAIAPGTQTMLAPSMLLTYIRTKLPFSNRPCLRKSPGHPASAVRPGHFLRPHGDLPASSVVASRNSGFSPPAPRSEKFVTKRPTLRYAPHIGKLPLAAALSPTL